MADLQTRETAIRFLQQNPNIRSSWPVDHKHNLLAVLRHDWLFSACYDANAKIFRSYENVVGLLDTGLNKPNETRVLPAGFRITYRNHAGVLDEALARAVSVQIPNPSPEKGKVRIAGKYSLDVEQRILTVSGKQLSPSPTEQQAKFLRVLFDAHATGEILSPADCRERAGIGGKSKTRDIFRSRPQILALINTKSDRTVSLVIDPTPKTSKRVVRQRNRSSR
jgi:hypothetical protein